MLVITGSIILLQKCPAHSLLDNKSETCYTTYMEIKTVSRSKVRKVTIELATKFLRKELKLERSKFQLTIYTMSGLRKREGYNGVVAQTGEREITMMVDSRLGEGDLIQCVAHEMVHVKQIAKGQLTTDIRNNQLWLGQRVNVVYHERPWEQEAFARERLLASRALAFAEKELGKMVKKLAKTI